MVDVMVDTKMVFVAMMEDVAILEILMAIPGVKVVDNWKSQDLNNCMKILAP